MHTRTPTHYQSRLGTHRLVAIRGHLRTSTQGLRSSLRREAGAYKARNRDVPSRRLWQFRRQAVRGSPQCRRVSHLLHPAGIRCSLDRDASCRCRDDNPRRIDAAYFVSEIHTVCRQCRRRCHQDRSECELSRGRLSYSPPLDQPPRTTRRISRSRRNNNRRGRYLAACSEVGSSSRRPCCTRSRRRSNRP